MAAKPKPQTYVIPPIETDIVRLTVKGLSQLVTHNWDKKAKQQILDKQMQKPKQAKEKRDPWADYCGAFYWMSKMPKKPTKATIARAKFGVPAVAFKNAMVDACRYVDGMTMTVARGALFVRGELVEIQGGKPHMREDMVRINNGMGTDIRFRPEFPTWECTFDVEYNSKVLSPEQIVNLCNIAGFHVGVCENRPGKSGGSWGRFQVKQQQLSA